MSTQWVRSKWNREPKDGEKYEVVDCHSDFYSTVKEYNGGYNCRLPKSDYVPCEAPVEWATVPIELIARNYNPLSACYKVSENGHTVGDIEMQDGYRVVSLVVEKKVTR